MESKRAFFVAHILVENLHFFHGLLGVQGKCVKFVPKFTNKNLPKCRNVTYLEDPGILNAHYNSLAGHLVRNKTGPIPAAQAGSILLCRFFWCLGVRVTQTTTPNL